MLPQTELNGMRRRCRAAAACFAAPPARKDAPRRCGRRHATGRRVADKPVAVDRTVRLREPDGSSSVRSASWERAQRCPVTSAPPSQVLLPRLCLSVRLCDSSGPHQAFAVPFDDGELGLHSCFSISTRDDERCATRRISEPAGAGHCRHESPACPRYGAPRRPVSFLSRSLHKTYLAEIHVSNIFSRYQKMFHSNYRRRIAFRLRAQSRAMPSADIRFAAGRFSTRPIS